MILLMLVETKKEGEGENKIKLGRNTKGDEIRLKRNPNIVTLNRID